MISITCLFKSRCSLPWLWSTKVTSIFFEESCFFSNNHSSRYKKSDNANESSWKDATTSVRSSMSLLWHQIRGRHIDFDDSLPKTVKNTKL